MKNASERQEKISVMADGELDPGEFDTVLSSLRHPESREDWDLYHRIGDAIRSDDMAADLSPDFAARMSARLEAEPTILAPVANASGKNSIPVHSASQTARRIVVPGIAAALAVFTAYLIAPQFQADGDAKPAENFASSALASASSQAIASASSAALLAAAAPVADSATSAPAQEAVVLRDPNIDEYLLAHQRYSPSLYDTSQFVRSATFDTEPKK